jgi:hypothetical protein
VSAVKDILHTAINETLLGKTYDMSDAQNWSKLISSSALAAVKGIIMKKWKKCLKTFHFRTGPKKLQNCSASGSGPK